MFPTYSPFTSFLFLFYGFNDTVGTSHFKISFMRHKNPKAQGIANDDVSKLNKTFRITNNEVKKLNKASIKRNYFARIKEKRLQNSVFLHGIEC